MNKDYTREEWIAEGERLFGEDLENWKFRCPRCGNIASGQDFKDAGADLYNVNSECIGRYVKGKGCDWASNGLIDICKVHVAGYPVFEFAQGESLEKEEKIEKIENRLEGDNL